MDKRTVTVATRITEEEKEMLMAHVTDLQIAHGNKARITESSVLHSVLWDYLEEQGKQDFHCKHEVA